MTHPLVAIVYYANPDFSPHVRRQSATLHQCGLRVWGIGVTHPDQVPHCTSILDKNDTACQPVWARRGALSFIHFMFHSFCVLWKSRPYLLQAIDPPALLPCTLHSLIRGIPLHYLSLEDFPDCTPLVNRPLVRALWLALEALCIKRARAVAMVAQVDADSYVQRYRIAPPFIVRNVPSLGPLLTREQLTLRKRFGWTADHFVMMYHGMLEPGRGIERVFHVLEHFPHARYAVAGYGTWQAHLQELARERGIADSIGWVGPYAHEELPALLQDADLGIMLICNVSKSYYQALPCKLFECVHAVVPVLASFFPQMQSYIEGCSVGLCVSPDNDEQILETVKELIPRGTLYRQLRQACRTERTRTNWETEEHEYRAFLGLCEGGH